MPNQKISELTAIVTVDNSVDVLPIVDISANTTKKVTPNALKTALALDNVNNTSDANKPVSIAQQDALNAKVDENAPIVAATKTKITYDAKGLVTAGDILDAADMPTGINAANIGTGVVSSTEFGYLDGVTSAIQTQIDGKQATLVSGTNIKTINSTSLLGSGDITISASPSGVSGAIQFSNGSAFASDASNLFWDNTNKRLGIGTNAPAYPLEVNGTAKIQSFQFIGGDVFASTNIRFFPTNGISINKDYSYAPANTLLHIKGSGSTSATTSLLVQNSAGTAALTIKDDLSATFGGSISNSGSATFGIVFTNQACIGAINSSTNAFTVMRTNNSTGNATFDQSVAIGTTSAPVASAGLEVVSTTKGFLPPRMTTTQKNAIASPAAGLVVYDSTTNKLCCYNGSTWNDLF